MKTTTFLSCFFSCLLFFLACSDGSETTEIPSTEEPATIPAPERAQPVFDGLDASSTKPSPDGEASDEDTEVAESTEDTETAIEDPDSSPLEEAADGESLSDGKDSDNGSGTEPLDGFVDEDGDEPLPEEGDGFEEEEESSGETTVITAASCFSDIASPDVEAPDYDQFEGLVVGSHCKGSNHQDIQGVEKIVVIGDSITQGSPNDIHPTCIDTAHFYRNLLAEWLAGEFGVDQGNLFDWGSWKTYNCAYNGTAALTHSGDFSNCSKWGAKTDDLIEGGNQLPDCLDDFPDFGSEKTTLFFFTIGGNDVGSINQAGFEASPEEVAAGYPEAWALAQSTIVYLEEAVAWLKDPANFPNGSYVVFGTITNSPTPPETPKRVSPRRSMFRLSDRSNSRIGD